MVMLLVMAPVIVRLDGGHLCHEHRPAMAIGREHQARDEHKGKDGRNTSHTAILHPRAVGRP
jgi:hypothetical protein